MNKVPMIDGVRRINRHELGRFEKPLYIVSTETKDVIVYYEGDSIPDYLTAVVE